MHPGTTMGSLGTRDTVAAPGSRLGGRKERLVREFLHRQLPCTPLTRS